MNVLVLIGQLPYPLDTGAKIRTYNLLVRLADRHRMTMVCYTFDDSDRAKLEHLRPFFKDIITVPYPRDRGPMRRNIDLMKNCLSPLPYSIEKFATRELNLALREAAEREPFDLLHCDSLKISHNIEGLEALPTVLTEHNVESLIWQRFSDLEATPLKKLYLGHQARKLRQYEIETCRRVKRVIAMSEEDRRILEEMTGAFNVDAIPNGVDCSYFTASHESPEADHLVFTGSMDWIPNEDAMVYFVGEVLPFIREARPSVHLSVVGRSPTSKVRQLASGGNGVEVTGRVEDIRPYIARAGVYVVPIRFGSGTRLKILEAMAMGRPVVSTRLGCEGLSVNPGKDILVADDPREFAERVLEVLRDDALAASLGEAGRSLVEREYDWPRLSEQLEEVWQRTAGRERTLTS